MLDLIVDRRDMRSVIANALRFMGAVRSEPVPVVRAVAGRRRRPGSPASPGSPVSPVSNDEPPPA